MYLNRQIIEQLNNTRHSLPQSGMKDASQQILLTLK